MTIKDPPHGRLAATAMRDLLRQLDREATAYRPARPNPPALPLRSPESAPSERLRVGTWEIGQDPLSGDLVAIDPDGNTHTIISRGES